MENMDDNVKNVALNKLSSTNSKFSEVQTSQLIHELEMHQRELEMQKEELIRAKEQAENATQKYTQLYDFAPSGYFTLSNSGKIVELNLTGSKLLQEEKSTLIDVPFIHFISEDTKMQFKNFLQNVFRSDVKGCCEVKLILKNTTFLNVYLTAVLTENKAEILIAAVDITQMKLTKSALKDSEERYRELVDHLDIGIILHNNDTSILYSNPKASELIGLTNQQIAKKHSVNKAWEFIKEDNSPLAPENYPIKEILRNKTAIKNTIIGIKKYKNDYIQWFLINGFPVFLA